MLTIAYLANLFPSSVEPYVLDEIEELRSRGVRIVAGSVRRPKVSDAIAAEIVLQAVSPLVLVRALWLCLRGWLRISDLIWRVAFYGSEGPWQRAKALVHTWLGVCYAVMLEKYEVDHIHVHHGYFGSWIGMVAARLLNVGFSLTLHGSDLFVRNAYTDAKLKDCSFCLTISEFNRRYILEQYPAVAAGKVLVSRLGVEMAGAGTRERTEAYTGKLKLLTVGRLQAVKNHSFLIHACAELNRLGLEFECSIAGDGPERRKLKKLIRVSGLTDRVRLLGHVPRERMHDLYHGADVVVLTSLSEGVPLVLMEAMAQCRIVLAPAITGIPELVVPGKTGFLYRAGSLPDFLERLFFIRLLMQARFGHYFHLIPAARQLDWMRHAAQVQVRHNFNRQQNLKSFADLFLSRIVPPTERLPYANLVLQQI
jgi:colanic acid/amylovoran biosynthesis glycosyltransferase